MRITKQNGMYHIMTLDDKEFDIFAQALNDYRKEQVKAHRAVVAAGQPLTERDFNIPLVATMLEICDPFL